MLSFPTAANTTALAPLLPKLVYRPSIVGYTPPFRNSRKIQRNKAMVPVSHLLQVQQAIVLILPKLVGTEALPVTQHHRYAWSFVSLFRKEHIFADVSFAFPYTKYFLEIEKTII